MQVAVYRNRNSHCAILLNENLDVVQYISTEEDNGSLVTDVRKMEATDFHAEYKELATYPVGRAIEHYTTPLTAAIRMSDRAAKALHKLSTDKAIAMNDQARMTLAERNVLATYHASIKKTGPCPAVAPCQTMELVPGSSKKPKKGTWDKKETPTEANHDATVRAVRNHNEAQTKAAKKAARLEQKKMNDTTNTAAAEATENTAAKKPASKPAAKKAAPTKKPATKEATASKTNTTKATKAAKEKTVSDKTTAKKTTAAKKTATKADPKASKAAPKKAAGKAAAPAKATKLAKGTGKAATAAKGAGKAAPAAKGKAAKKPDGDAARRGRKGSFDESQKIKVLVKDNPKREGTASYDTFELLRKSKTVGDFFANGGASHNLHWNIERGYIEVN